MKKNIRKNGSKALALSILGGSILSPLAVSADNIFGPIQTDKLEELEKDQDVEIATSEHLKDAIKTSNEDYKIIFGDQEGGSIKKGEEYLIYPAYLTLKNGKSVKLSDFNNSDIKNFVEQNSVIATAGEENSKVNVEYDGIYHIRQIKRAPGSYLNPFLSKESRYDNGFYGKGESLGFEFPKMEGGIISNDQSIVVDPKDIDVDSGTNEPLVGETDIENIVGNIIVAKYGDKSKNAGHIHEEGSFDSVDSEFKNNTLSGARFTIKQTKKPVDTKRDFLEDITIEDSNKYEGAKEAKERNKATFEKVEDNEYFAELTYNDEGTLAITGRKGDFNGLPEGVYVIDEIQPPKGYTRTNMNIEITITVAENGIDRVVMVGDGTGDRKNGEGLYLIEDKDFAEGDHSYGLKVNNYIKPGKDPNKPISKGIRILPHTPVDNSVIVNPGQFFEYIVSFTVPEDINEYKYLEVYDNFDNSINTNDIKVSIVIIENNRKKILINEEDFKLHNDGNKFKVVFTKNGISKLKNSTEITVKYDKVRFSEDLTSAEVQEIMDNEIGYVENIAKLHFVNGSGYTVNPLDPDKKPTNPDGDNPHVNPNPENPFELDKNNKPSQPEIPKGSKDIRVPEVPESNVVTAVPIARDFEFKKVDRTNKPLEGAEFELVPIIRDVTPGPMNLEMKSNSNSHYFYTGQLEIIDGKVYVDKHELKGRTFKAKSDENGVVRFEGVPYGTYKLKEVKAPKGYRLNNEDFLLLLNAHLNEDTGRAITNMTLVKATYKDDNLVMPQKVKEIVSKVDGSITVSDGEEYFKMVNYKYNETPKTGTLGKVIYIGAGTLAITIGLLGLKRRND